MIRRVLDISEQILSVSAAMTEVQEVQEAGNDLVKTFGILSGSDRITKISGTIERAVPSGMTQSEHIGQVEELLGKFVL